jgi:Kef-type K+ transport system membrane component KefB
VAASQPPETALPAGIALNTTESFLIAMGIIFIVPYVLWRVLRHDSFAPLVVVQMIAGVLLGPGALGKLLPAYYATVFSAPVVAALNGIASWGVLLFIGNAGIELDLRQAWAGRREAGLTAVLALGVPLLCGCLVAMLLLQQPAWSGSAAAPWQFVLAVGMTCAVTAVPVLIVFLDKLAILREPLGQRVLRYASLDDIAIWGVLAVILLQRTQLVWQLVYLAGFAAAACLLRRLMPCLQQRDRWYVSFIWLLLAAWGAEWAGLHYLVGAFLSGAVLDGAWFDRAQLTRFRQYVLLTLMPVFFLSAGLRTTWALGGQAVLLLGALLALAAIGGKLLGVRLAGALLGWSRDEALVIGWLLQSKGLVMIVFTSVLLDKHLISGATFTALLLMGLISTILTVPVVAPRLHAARSAAARTA